MPHIAVLKQQKAIIDNPKQVITAVLSAINITSQRTGAKTKLPPNADILIV